MGLFGIMRGFFSIEMKLINLTLLTKQIDSHLFVCLIQVLLYWFKLNGSSEKKTESKCPNELQDMRNNSS